jgi:hypothetical protein
MKSGSSFSVFALPLAVALVATTAHAEQAKKQPKPASIAPLKVDSPNMATSVRDWHPELNPRTAQTTRTASAIGCTCGKSTAQTATARQTATATQTATNMTAVGQRGNPMNRSGKRMERAREVPLASIPR